MKFFTETLNLDGTFQFLALINALVNITVPEASVFRAISVGEVARCDSWHKGWCGHPEVSAAVGTVPVFSLISREGGDLGVAFQAPTGSQASPRGEAKDSALLPSRDADILVPPVWPQGSPASSSLLREDSSGAFGLGRAQPQRRGTSP